MPLRRDFGDRPAESMAFDQQFDAVTKTTIGFDRDLIEDAAREQAETVGGVSRRQAGWIIERQIPNDCYAGLNNGTARHSAAGSKTAGANDIETSQRLRDHAVYDAGIVIVVRGQHEDEGRFACRKACYNRRMRAATAIAHKVDIHSGKRFSVIIR